MNAARLPLWSTLAIGLIAGALLPLGLAPFNVWPLALLGLLLWASLLHCAQGRHYFKLSFSFGLGLFGAGVHWVYVSIHTYGNASELLAGAMTALFVAFLAFMFALPWWCYQRFLDCDGRLLLLAFPALWLLNEAYRSWIFTGFPWLHIGYGHLHTPLAGWAPVLGVFGVGGLLALTVSALLWAQQQRRYLPALLTVAAIWLGGFALQHLQWTKDTGVPLNVAMVQPNIPQEHKWDRAWLQPTYDLLRDESAPLWDSDWIIWPEAALPTILSDAQPFMAEMAEMAKQSNVSLVTGVIADLNRRYYNSLVVLGMGSGIYHKQQLVPFGEYVPFEDQLRGLIQFFNLPMSVLHQGPADQAPLWLGQIPVLPAVCYEIVYPDLVASGARHAQVILTVSNDAWFGRSIAPVQHLQMAQMRALETGRYVIRATNNGISAIVNERGEITVQGQQFVRQSLRGAVQPRTGLTPFVTTGSWPVLLLCALVLFFVGWRRRQEKIAVSASSADNH